MTALQGVDFISWEYKNLPRLKESVPSIAHFRRFVGKETVGNRETSVRRELERIGELIDTTLDLQSSMLLSVEGRTWRVMPWAASGLKLSLQPIHGDMMYGNHIGGLVGPVLPTCSFAM
jgi:hypothetical protein